MLFLNLVKSVGGSMDVWTVKLRQCLSVSDNRVSLLHQGPRAVVRGLNRSDHIFHTLMSSLVLKPHHGFSCVWAARLRHCRGRRRQFCE